jgi:hypothetical protein
MPESVADQVRALDPGELAPIVRNVLGDSSAVPLPGCTAEPVGGAHFDTRTGAILRVRGTARSAGGQTTWSAVVKTVELTPASAEYLGFIDPAREVSAYSYGLFDSPSSAFRAAKLYGITDRSDTVKWLWLEDLSDAAQPPWSAEEYLQTARHLGRFNGEWTAKELPSQSWLSRDTIRRRFAIPEGPGHFRALREHRDHPAVRTTFSNETVDRLLRFEEDMAVIHAAVSPFEQTVCHGDCVARNLFPYTDAAGRPITVAVDWSGVGIDFVGCDGGTMFGSGMSWGLDEAELVHSIRDALFEAYIEGLRDSGWSGDVRHVRLAYLMAAVVYVMMSVWFANALAEDRLEPIRPHFERRAGVTAEEIPEWSRALAERFLPLADEARELAETV